MYLDDMVYAKSAPEITHALEFYGLGLTSKINQDKTPSLSWVGLNISDKAGRVTVSSHQSNSTLRNLIMPGDELIAINSMRVNNVKSIKTILSKLDPNETICYNHEGIVKSVTAVAECRVELKTKLDGNNQRWKRYIATRALEFI